MTESMKEGDFLGIHFGCRQCKGSDAPEHWESLHVGPDGYGQIIVEDDQRNTRDNFRLKVYSEKEGLHTC